MSAEDQAAGPAGATGGREETGNTKNNVNSSELSLICMSLVPAEGYQDKVFIPCNEV